MEARHPQRELRDRVDRAAERFVAERSADLIEVLPLEGLHRLRSTICKLSTLVFKLMFMSIDMRNEMKFISIVLNGFHAFIRFYTISKAYGTHIQKVRYAK